MTPEWGAGGYSWVARKGSAENSLLDKEYPSLYESDEMGVLQENGANEGEHSCTVDEAGVVSNPDVKPNWEAVAKVAGWLRRLVAEGQVVELRALRVSTGDND